VTQIKFQFGTNWSHFSRFAGGVIGLAWWSFGMVLALGYFFFVYRQFRGKVRLEAEDQGY